MTAESPPRRFDHRGRGTPATAWAARVAELPRPVEIERHDHLLVLAAHPDDETLGAGGLIADAHRAGAQVTVVVATQGEASHPDSQTHSPELLAALRRGELTTAVERLAPGARLVLLERPDGHLADDVAGLTAALECVARSVTTLAAPWRGDGHPDHAACGEAAASVAHALRLQLLEYPVWGWWWGRPGHDGPLRGDGWVARPMSGDARTAKTAAIAAHRSQHTPLSPRPGDEPVLAPAVLEHFAGDVEVFLAARHQDLPSSYFDRLYAADPDPWSLATGFYEHRKRALLLASLPRPRFEVAFEVGCGLGLNTAALGDRCDRVLAVDISAAAVAATRSRVAELPHVEVEEAAVPGDWPDGALDLVVLSEVGYYLADPGPLADRVVDSLTPHGVVVACHWRHPADDHPSSAEAVHDAIGRRLRRVAGHVEEDFLLDVWSVDGVSVARATGVIPEPGA